MVFFRDLSRISGELNGEIQHRPILLIERCFFVIKFERLNQPIVQRDPTQKLCVRLNSVDASVGRRNNGGDHLMLPPGQRQVRRHERTEGGEGMMQGVRNECMRRHNAGGLFVGRLHRTAILLRIERTLRRHRLLESLIRFGHRNCLYPGHLNSPLILRARRAARPTNSIMVQYFSEMPDDIPVSPGSLPRYPKPPVLGYCRTAKRVGSGQESGK